MWRLLLDLDQTGRLIRALSETDVVPTFDDLEPERIRRQSRRLFLFAAAVVLAGIASAVYLTCQFVASGLLHATPV